MDKWLAENMSLMLLTSVSAFCLVRFINTQAPAFALFNMAFYWWVYLGFEAFTLSSAYKNTPTSTLALAYCLLYVPLRLVKLIK